MTLISTKANFQCNKKRAIKFLIYGKTGHIGGLLGKICERQEISFEYGKARIEDRAQVVADIEAVRPTHVLNAAGVTGKPNADWCEYNRIETINTNVVGTLTLAKVCKEHNILMVNYSSGCLFKYDASHPQGSGIGFKEDDRPRIPHLVALYSRTQATAEELLREYDNVCNLRLRMPVSSDFTHPRNFIYKVVRFQKVINVPNSMTILDELLPISVEMAKRNLTGVYNFTNPGAVSHNEILEMYRKYVDPSFSWVNFTVEEQDKILAVPRCNNELDASKLKKEFPELLSVKESLVKYVFEPNMKVPFIRAN